MSLWFARYRWVFLVATLVLLGLAYFITYKDKRSKTGGPWNKRILHSTTVLSLGMIVYTLIFNS